MADGLNVTPGSGVVVATDDVGGTHFQRVKVTFGVDGTATDVTAAAGLPVVATAGSNITGATYDAGFHTAYAVTRGVGGAAVTSADASAGINITQLPTGGQKLVIVDLVFSVNADMQVDFKEETTGTIFYTFYCKAGAVVQFTPRSKFKLTTADKRLVADTTVAGACSFSPSYYSEV